MKKFLLLAVLLLTLFISSRAQVVDSMINVYAEQLPDQKIHVHFDKDLYRAGETIWFKAYVFSGFSLDAVSKNFYAELINDKGTVVQRKVYPIVESVAPGNFDLPDSLPAGRLVFRGYTTWQLNFDTTFLFQKNIMLLDKAGLESKSKSITTSVASTIKFFPEGGNLVSTLASVVAFKGTDEAGIPVFVKGNIVNSRDEVVTTFTTRHDGMGTFTLTPAPGESYKAIWSDESGKQQVTPLPEAQPQGYVLKLTDAGGKKVFTLTRTAQVPDNWKKVVVMGILGQQRVYRAAANFEGTSTTSGYIPVENFPAGIMQVTVFSSDWQPIAERIVMINNDNYLFNAKVTTPELSTNFRAKNTLEISVEDTLLTNLSIAVTDAAAGRQGQGDNIISRVLLTGDLKGYVHNPAYYFSGNADSIAAHLDLVMLTHGWRRYNWAMLAAARRPRLKYPPDSYLTLDARVFGVTTASPLRNDEELLVFLEGRDSLRQLVQLPKTGVDKFSLPVVFFDTASVFYQFMKDKKAEHDMALAFNNNLYKGVRQIDVVNRPVLLQYDTLAAARERLLAERLGRYGSKFEAGGNVLQTVTVKTRAKSKLQELDEKYASGLFRGADGYAFDLTNEPVTGFYDIFAFLQGRVAGLQITGNGSSATLSWRGSSPSLFLNEMPSDVSMISTVSVPDIAYIKVLRPPFIGAAGGGAGGAIAIYTKKGSDTRPLPGRGLSKSIVTGYSSIKEFYSPDYKDLSASSQVTADYRSTLLWKPLITTDASRKKVRVEFFNNDITKAYRVVLEGVNEIGKLVRIEKVIQQ